MYIYSAHAFGKLNLTKMAPDPLGQYVTFIEYTCTHTMYVCHVHLCVTDCTNSVTGNCICTGNITVICAVKHFNTIIILIT